jgi:hypothetical protein
MSAVDELYPACPCPTCRHFVQYFKSGRVMCADIKMCHPSSVTSYGSSYTAWFDRKRAMRVDDRVLCPDYVRGAPTGQIAEGRRIWEERMGYRPKQMEMEI